jgi:glycosyltransferase involved in cell wall biosynthesis
MDYKLRAFFKKCYLYFNDKTIKTRFFFDAEYKRWEKFDLNRVSKKEIFIDKEKKSSIYFLIPGSRISGGIAVILQYANRLLVRGYDIKILSLSKNNNTDWFPDQKVDILPYKKTREILKSGEADILIATAYSTAFTVDMANARRKLYFVQSDESRFFPEDRELTEKIKKTYQLPLEYIATVSWLREWLKKEYEHDAFYVPNGLDLNIFYKTEPIEPKKDKIRILIEGGINIPYKGMEDAYEAIKDLDCELWIVSNNGKPKNGWKYDRFFENVPFIEMPKIYSSCDILLKMSKVESFCYPPLEMMACGGVSVIKKVTGIEEYTVDGKNCFIVYDVKTAREAIQKIIINKKIRDELINNGYETTQNWSWENGISNLIEIIEK